ncbi:MAG: hypothetical protein HOO86_16850 [Bacteroidales bacterium]|nr:hypothetical protein [Bacteroidales bacterium]
MFNSPLLDITIGLVFIFLIYSLLVTSINEVIASLFGLRARMLKSAIVVGMLSNTSKDSRWKSLFKGIKGFFGGLVHHDDRSVEEKAKIGEKIFDHPLIKNYGSSRFFPLPSYIPTNNFSTVLIDVLLKEFNDKVEDIARYKLTLTADNESLENTILNLRNSNNTIKIKELLAYYGHHYAEKDAAPPLFIIDKETWQILQMHLQNSLYDIDQFVRKIEGWFDDSMDRVSGWYKRQSQLILIILGFMIALIFNVDTLEITGKLSTDKDARDKLVQMATQAVDQYKDDPRVKKMVTADGVEVIDNSGENKEINNAIFKEYQAKSDSVKNLLKGDINKTNEIIAAGWKTYGGKKSLTGKVGYVLKRTFTSPRKFLGFMILAFAVSLGAPFWFDLLNKLVKLRNAGKKEEDKNNATPSKINPAQTPVTVNINTQPNGEEAVG